MSDWQPIETAPKDGTVLLLWGEFTDASEPFIGWYDDRDSRRPEMPFGPFVWRQHKASTVAERCVRWWMPLPQPPEETL
jgi:hypothetical protein